MRRFSPLAFFLFSVLAACGGGGGSGPSPASPTSTPTPKATEKPTPKPTATPSVPPADYLNVAPNDYIALEGGTAQGTSVDIAQTFTTPNEYGPSAEPCSAAAGSSDSYVLLQGAFNLKGEGSGNFYSVTRNSGGDVVVVGFNNSCVSQFPLAKALMNTGDTWTFTNPGTGVMHTAAVIGKAQQPMTFTVVETAGPNKGATIMFPSVTEVAYDGGDTAIYWADGFGPVQLTYGLSSLDFENVAQFTAYGDYERGAAMGNPTPTPAATVTPSPSPSPTN